tara:strand:+ start:1604 stop:2338 length:735 start_codon:yes stop_codon:yes gene_type:complete
MINRIQLICFLYLANLYAHGISDSDKHEVVHGSLFDFVFLGAKHMVTGYDHILFLVGVLFFLTKASDIVKFITLFTLGHSITLVFATLYKITANYYLIDAVIAFSVIYKGFENLEGFKKIGFKNPPNLLLMVFIFGLIHGFGLSTRLQQLDLGSHNILPSILSFNVGVELGQIVALFIVYPCLLLLRKGLMQKISILVNGCLVLLGAFLLAFQLNGYFFSERHSDYNVEPATHSHDDTKTTHKH